jgi:hypothetical protein
MLAVFFLARLGMREVPGFAGLAGLFGLLQRINVIIGFAWITLLGVHMLLPLRGGSRWVPLLIGTVAMCTVSSVLTVRSVTGGCTMVHTVVSTEIGAPPEFVAALYADYTGWPRLFPATIRGARLLADDGQRKTIEVDHASEGKVINIMVVVSAERDPAGRVQAALRRAVRQPVRSHPSGYAIFHHRRRSAQGGDARTGFPCPANGAGAAKEIRARADAGRCREGVAKGASRQF